MKRYLTQIQIILFIIIWEVISDLIEYFIGLKKLDPTYFILKICLGSILLASQYFIRRRK